MGLDALTLTTGLQPEITVKSRSRENYADALAKTKNALYEKMHNMVDYYCEQISLLDRSSIQDNRDQIDELTFWGELQRYTTINFEEKEHLFHKFYGTKDFDCYCTLVDYGKMQLPWPDGYKEPGSRIDKLAPIGLNDNYFFYAEGNILYRLDFGTCEHKELRIENGAVFNKRMETVAKQNYDTGRLLPGLDLVRDAFEKLIKAKHGDGSVDTLSIMEILDNFATLIRSKPGLRDYSLQILPDVDDTTSNFPQRFALFKNDKLVYLEEFFDNIYF